MSQFTGDEARTRSGIPIEAYYPPDGASGSEGIEIPGEFPYTRGRHRPQTANGRWIQRELSGEGGPERSNEQLKYLLGKGQTGLDFIGDAPTQSNLDPDHPHARHTVGTQGVSICNKHDYLKLLDGIPIDKVSVSSSVPPISTIAGLYLAAKHYGIDPASLRGSAIQIPLYGEDCSYAYMLPCSLRVRLAVDSIAFCAEKMPKFHAYIEDTYFFSESGLNAVEEMALGFVEIRHLTRKLLERGVNVDAFAPRIGILVNCSMDFFEEIAKIRASRRIYAKMMKGEFGAQDPRSMSAVFTSHTSGLTLTAQQPANNIVRGAVQGMALALSGCQAIEISAFDEAFRTPSEAAHLVGLRTQQIIDIETGVSAVEDPLGGSYYVEALTDTMENRIWNMIREIESAGDPEVLSEEGYFRNIFHRGMEQHHKALQSQEKKVVGVNVHTLPEEQDTLLRDIVEGKIDPYYDRIKEITQFKLDRNHQKTAESLRALKAACQDETENLMQHIVNAFDEDATVGEITGTMRLAANMPFDTLGCVEAPFDL